MAKPNPFQKKNTDEPTKFGEQTQSQQAQAEEALQAAKQQAQQVPPKGNVPPQFQKGGVPPKGKPPFQKGQFQKKGPPQPGQVPPQLAEATGAQVPGQPGMPQEPQMGPDGQPLPPGMPGMPGMAPPAPQGPINTSMLNVKKVPEMKVTANPHTETEEFTGDPNMTRKPSEQSPQILMDSSGNQVSSTTPKREVADPNKVIKDKPQEGKPADPNAKTIPEGKEQDTKEPEQEVPPKEAKPKFDGSFKSKESQAPEEAEEAETETETEDTADSSPQEDDTSGMDPQEKAAYKAAPSQSNGSGPTKAGAKQVPGNRTPSKVAPKNGHQSFVEEELTTGQTGIVYGLPQAPIVMVTDPNVITLYKKYATIYEEYRTIRKDPTISLCREVIEAAIVSASWAVKSAEGVPKEVQQYIEDQLVHLRSHIMHHALHMLDYGWQGFEKIFDIRDRELTTSDGTKTEKLVGIRKLKPLLQDMTSIMVFLHNGDFAGFRQGVVFIEAPAKAVLISFRVEGTMWHGCPLLEDAKASVERWNVCEDGAGRYDEKIAGSHFVVYYPQGSSEIEGKMVDNSLIAKQIAMSMESSGIITLPSSLIGFAEGMENNSENQAWKVDFLSDKGARQTSFVDRLRYLDSCKARAMHIPERAIMEGQFGTKAEAEGHQDLMVMILEYIARLITQEINMQVVDHLLELNWGPELLHKVWLESSPISDDKIAMLRNLFNTMLGNQNGFMEIFPYIDYGTMLDLIEVPTNRDVVKSTPEEQAMPGMTPEQIDLAQKSGMTPGQPVPLGNVLANMKKGLNPNDPNAKPNPFAKKEAIDVPVEAGDEEQLPFGKKVKPEDTELEENPEEEQAVEEQPAKPNPFTKKKKPVVEEEV